MRVIKIKRIVTNDTKPNALTSRRPIREFARNFFAGENHWEFAIEALLFGALLAICAWPIVAAASAINALL